MKSREISRSKIGPFSLACTDPYIGIGWEYQSTLGTSWVISARSLSHFGPIYYSAGIVEKPINLSVSICSNISVMHDRFHTWSHVV